MKQSDVGSLLAPLGDHRRAHIQPSKGKKRKRVDETPTGELSTPPAPAVGSHVLIGLNSVTRHLEALAASSAPPTVPVKGTDDVVERSATSQNGTQTLPETTLKPLSVIVLTHPQPSLSPSHAHIPTLLHLTTLQTTPESEPTRLITLPTSNDARFANALHIPRVSAIGIYQGAPGAKAVEEYVRKHVGLTECPWVDEAVKPEWKGLNVLQV